MPPEIKQTLGFEASKAIETLKQLDTALKGYSTSLNSSLSSMQSFNTQAGKTVAALKHLASNSSEAVSQLSKLSGLKIKAPTGLGEVSGKKKLDVDTEIGRLQELYKVPSNVSKVQARAYQNAITQAAQFLAAHKKTGSKLKEINANIGANFKGLENTLANHLAKIRRATEVSIKAPKLDVSKYTRRVQKLIPLTEGATNAQKRAWQSLSTKIAETAVKNRLSIGKMVSVYGKLGQSLTGPSNKIANDMQRLVTAQEKVGASAKKTEKSWTVSWETMARVVGTQLIVRALSSIRHALREAVSEAINFQRAAAEIGTIAGGLGGLEKIEDLTRRVSDTFNIELADTTEAAYQTVSNQIASTEKDVESFLSSAAKFAKITKTDMTTAVNLLSGTLNAFGKEVSETEDVAAKFFNTIKLGRTRAEELAQGMGTINPIAQKLEISMEELNAAVATLTIQGLKTDKVVTQIRGAMQAFLKPTDAMIDAMQELGFETGEQVFEAFNLQEAIRAIIETTDGSAAAIAKYFPRVRGLTGVLGLATDANNHFNTSMEEQKEALGEVYDRAYHLIITTDAEIVTKALNKLKNVFIDVFGQQFLSGLAKGLGVLELLTADVNEFIIKAYEKRGQVQEDLLTKELQAEKDSLAKRAKLLAQYAATARKEFIAAANAAEDANQIIAASTKWAIDSMMGPIDAAIKGIQKAASEGKKLMDDFAKETSDSFEKVHETLFKRSVSIADDPNVKVSLLRRKSAEDSLKAQVLAAKATTKGELDAAKQLQVSSRAYNDEAFAISRTIKEKFVNGEVTRDLTKSELKLQKQRTSQISQDLVLRQNRWKIALDKGSEAVEKNRKSLSENAREVTEYKANLDILIGKMEEAQKTAASKDLTPEDQVKLAKEAQVAVEKFLTAYGQGIEKFSKSADPVVRKLFQAIEAQDLSVEIETIMTLPSNMQKIFEMIRSAANDFFQKIPIEIQLFAEEHGLAVDTPKQVDEVMRKYNQTLDEQATKANTAKKASGDLVNELEKIDALIKVLTSDVTLGETFGELFDTLWNRGGIAGAAREIADKGAQFRDFETVLDSITEKLKTGFTIPQAGTISKQLENISNRGFKSSTAMRGLSDAILKIPILQEQIDAGAGVGQRELITSNMLRAGELQEEQIRKSLEETMAIRQAREAIAAKTAETDAATQSQKALTQAVQEGSQAVAEQPAKVQQTNQEATQLQNTEAAITAEVGNTNSGIQQMTSQFQAAEQAARGVADATRTINPETGALTVQNPFNSNGGRVGYFANGGRGTDTIPAMLSAGEHVTNARSSRRFASQLQAINAGQQPVYRNDGGDTFNTNVGDINVSGARGPEATARTIMSKIRREERRGSGR